MRRVEFLLQDIRRRTDNEPFSDTQGIPDEEVLSYFNDAQDHLQELISNAGLYTFDTTAIIPATTNEFYPFPELILTGGRVRTIEYSRDGRDDGYGFLTRMVAQNRNSYSSESPCGYIPIANGFNLVSPLRYARGTLRITYEQQLFDLDKRRGTVTGAVVIDGVLQSITFAEDIVLSSNNIAINDYFCICDREGVVKVYGAPILSYTVGTRTITTSRETTASIVAGDFITLGKYSTTHSGLPRVCERYLLAYAQVALQDRDAMEVPATQNKRLLDIEQTIMETFADRDQDVKPWPMVSTYWFD